MASAKKTSFDVVSAFNINFWRKTTDLIVNIYVIIIVALWIGQCLPALTFRFMSYTTADSYGASRDYCSPAPLYNIDSAIINGFYNQASNNATVPASVDDAGVYKVQWLMMTGSNLDASNPPFHLFSVTGRNYCLGPTHYAVAYQLAPQGAQYSEFWNYVKSNRAAIYDNFDEAPHIRMLIFIYLLPLWIYLCLRVCDEIRMLVKFWQYENASVNKMQPVYWYSLVGVFVPLLFNIVAAALIAVKIAGVDLVQPSDIYIIMSMHIIATLLQYTPLLIMRIKTARATNDSGTAGSLEYKFGGGRVGVTGIEYKLAPPYARSMTVYYYMTSAIIIILVGLYLSQELAGLHFTIFNEHCASIGGVASTVDSCVDANGDAYHSENAHLVLAVASPALVLMFWRLAWFVYFCSMVDRNGSVPSTRVCGSCTQSVDIEMQANIVAITEWRINNMRGGGGLQLQNTSLLSETSSQMRMRLQLLGRFLLPLITAIIAVLLVILKMSQYALWHGLPWWALGVMITCSLCASMLMEVVPILAANVAKSRKEPLLSS